MSTEEAPAAARRPPLRAWKALLRRPRVGGPASLGSREAGSAGSVRLVSCSRRQGLVFLPARFVPPLRPHELRRWDGCHVVERLALCMSDFGAGTLHTCTSCLRLASHRARQWLRLGSENGRQTNLDTRLASSEADADRGAIGFHEVSRTRARQVSTSRSASSVLDMWACLVYIGPHRRGASFREQPWR